MVQLAIPISTIAQGASVGILGAPTVHEALDEPIGTPNDSDQVAITAVGESFEVGLSALLTPDPDGGSFVAKVRARLQGSGSSGPPTFTAKLKSGGVVVATGAPVTTTASFATYDALTLSAGEIAAITNWASGLSLLLEFTTNPTVTDSVRFATAAFQTPDPGGTFVVEDGTGKSDANSYATVDECTTYNVNHNDVAAWASAASAARKKALRQATQYLDARYGGIWRGQQETATQALDWPRVCALDDNGYTLEDVPKDLKDACCELAIRALSESLMPDVSEPGSISAESFTVGPIESSVEYAGGKSQTKAFTIVDKLVRQLVLDHQQAVRA